MPQPVSVFVPVIIDVRTADVLAEIAFARGQTPSALVRGVLAACTEDYLADLRAAQQDYGAI